MGSPGHRKAEEGFGAQLGEWEGLLKGCRNEDQPSRGLNKFHLVQLRWYQGILVIILESSNYNHKRKRIKILILQVGAYFDIRNLKRNKGITHGQSASNKL